MRKIFLTTLVFFLMALPLTRNNQGRAELGGKEASENTSNLFPLSPIASASDTLMVKNQNRLLASKMQQEDDRSHLDDKTSPSERLAGMLIVGGEITVNGKPVKTGATVLEGNVVSTGANSYAVISFGSFGQVEIPPNTTIEIASQQGTFSGIENSTKESITLPVLPLMKSENLAKKTIYQAASSVSTTSEKSGFLGLVQDASRASLNVTSSHTNNQNNGNQGNNGNHHGWCIGRGHHNHSNRGGNGHQHHDHNCSPIRPCR